MRNRLARELHDSVGHALSAVTLQAAAARRVLDRDPAFVREALAAIEDTTRRTVGELDAVLGLLRDGDPAGPDAAFARRWPPTSTGCWPVPGRREPPSPPTRTPDPPGTGPGFRRSPPARRTGSSRRASATPCGTARPPWNCGSPYREGKPAGSMTPSGVTPGRTVTDARTATAGKALETAKALETGKAVETVEPVYWRSS
ncbi:histidine kinase [Streptomyces xanthophaeus]|uniref:histidine kinase dimerization/phosphoacceptor domain-containing protein n=1 Tax=Streptomyces xanthophaeus TaxID=67385 RepID=UPI003863BA55